MNRRSDAKPKPWRISEKGAPSPRALQQALNRYARSLEIWAAQVLAETMRNHLAVRPHLRADAAPPKDPTQAPPTPGTAQGVQPGPADAAAVARTFGEQLQIRLHLPPRLGGPPTPPPASLFAGVGKPSMTAAIRSEYTQLVAAGMPRRVLEPVIGPVAKTPVTGSILGNLRDGDVIDLLVQGPGEKLLTDWALEGEALIKDIAGQWVPEVAANAVQTVASGARWETLAKDLLQVGQMPRYRAALIAQDQTARLNGKVTQSMQQAAKITHYTWRSSKDNRVRPRHGPPPFGVDGQVFSWAEGAPNVGFYGEHGHPGQSGRCRCRAVPVVPPAWTL